MFMPGLTPIRLSNCRKLLALCLFLTTLTLSKAENLVPVGVIDSFKGIVTLRPAGAKKEVRLRPKLDVGKLLFGKDQISLESGAEVRYTIGNRQSVLKGPKRGYPIPQPRGRADQYTEAMRHYARIGGRKRGGEKQIFRPAPDGSVVVEGFAIQWTPDPAVTDGDAKLTSGGAALWQGSISGGSNGKFKDTELTKAIRDAQDAESIRPMVVEIAFSDGTIGASTFNLLSKAQTEKLKAALAAVDKQSGGITRGLLRTRVLRNANLLNAVADELENTLRLAPESVDLMRATLTAQLEVGNVRRAHELNLKLPKADRPKE